MVQIQKNNAILKKCWEISQRRHLNWLGGTNSPSKMVLEKKEIMEIKLLSAKEAHRGILRQLCEFYCYDFSEYTDADVDLAGHFHYRYLDHYWTEKGRYAFLILVDEHYAGFVMVNNVVHQITKDEGQALAEFFILRKYRRKGIGKQIAHQVFDKYPGKWEVAQELKNTISIAFWDQVIKDYLGPSTFPEVVVNEKNQKRIIIF